MARVSPHTPVPLFFHSPWFIRRHAVRKPSSRPPKNTSGNSSLGGMQGHHLHTGTGRPDGRQRLTSFDQKLLQHANLSTITVSKGNTRSSCSLVMSPVLAALCAIIAFTALLAVKGHQTAQDLVTCSANFSRVMGATASASSSINWINAPTVFCTLAAPALH